MEVGTITVRIEIDVEPFVQALGRVRESIHGLARLTEQAASTRGDTAMSIDTSESTAPENMQRTLSWDITLQTWTDEYADDPDMSVYVGRIETVDSHDITLNMLREKFPSNIDDDVMDILDTEPDEVEHAYGMDTPERYLWYNYRSYDDPFTGDTYSFKHSLVVELNEWDSKDEWLHDVPGREVECRCDECHKPDPKGKLRSIVDDVVYSALSSNPSYPKPFTRLYGTTLAITVETDDGDEDVPLMHMSTIKNYDGTSVTVQRSGFMTVRSSGMWVDADDLAAITITGDGEDAETKTFTVKEVAQAIESKLSSPGGHGLSVVAENDTSALYTSSPVALYKVTDARGEARNGGSYTYSLPTKTKGDWGNDIWVPGDWSTPIERLDMCAEGYHVTTDVSSWWEYGSRIFTVETSGMHPQSSSDKFVCKSIRLLREVELHDVLPRTGWQLDFFDGVIVPALESFARVHDGIDPLGPMPAWLTTYDPGMAIGALRLFTSSGRYGDLRNGESPTWLHDKLYVKVRELTPYETTKRVQNLVGITLEAAFFSQDEHQKALWQDAVANGYLPIGMEMPFGRIVCEAHGQEATKEDEALVTA